MNSHKQDISRLDKIEAGQNQLLQRQPDCSRYGIEGQNDSGNDDALHFPAGGVLETGDDKTNAGTDALDLGKLGREGVEDMGRLDNRDLPNLGSHTNSSARAGWSHGEQRNDMRAATKQRSNQSGWLIAPKNFEVSLEEAMELSIDFRGNIPLENMSADNLKDICGGNPREISKEEIPPHQCSASEGGCVQNTNRETISPTRPPIALAGVSSTPRDATSISSSRGSPWPTVRRAGLVSGTRTSRSRSRDTERPLEFESARPASEFPLSVKTAGSLLGRHSSRALTLGEGISPEIFSPIFSFTKTLLTAAACLDNKQHSERAVQNGYPATHKWNSCNDRVH